MDQEVRADIKAIRDKVENIDKNVAVNTASLGHHMKRTELAENRLSKLETWTLGLLTALLLAVTGVMIKLVIG